jgi:hypothetical protein
LKQPPTNSPEDASCALGRPVAGAPFRDRGGVVFNYDWSPKKPPSAHEGDLGFTVGRGLTNKQVVNNDQPPQPSSAHEGDLGFTVGRELTNKQVVNND